MGESYQIYPIYPILTCKLEMDRGHFTYRRNYGEKLLEFAQELLFQSSSQSNFDSYCPFGKFYYESMRIFDKERVYVYNNILSLIREWKVESRFSSTYYYRSKADWH